MNGANREARRITYSASVPRVIRFDKLRRITRNIAPGFVFKRLKRISVKLTIDRIRRIAKS